jgi:hypothetical protein
VAQDLERCTAMKNSEEIRIASGALKLHVLIGHNRPVRQFLCDH